MTQKQKLAVEILTVLERIKGLGINDAILSSAIKIHPNNTTAQMLYILGSLAMFNSKSETKPTEDETRKTISATTSEQ